MKFYSFVADLFEAEFIRKIRFCSIKWGFNDLELSQINKGFPSQLSITVEDFKPLTIKFRIS